MTRRNVAKKKKKKVKYRRTKWPADARERSEREPLASTRRVAPHAFHLGGISPRIQRTQGTNKMEPDDSA